MNFLTGTHVWNKTTNTTKMINMFLTALVKAKKMMGSGIIQIKNLQANNKSSYMLCTQRLAGNADVLTDRKYKISVWRRSLTSLFKQFDVLT